MSKNASILIAIAFLSIVGLAALTAHLPQVVFAFYVGASLLTFIFYAADKWAALTDRWRVQESTLHMLSLVGGWPGALIAQQVLRHKTRKQPFRRIFFLLSALNLGGFIYLFTPQGSALLLSLATGFS